MKWIETKLRMPVYSPVVQRGRLFSELECLKPASLISIIGDSGYGKTTLVASYIHEKRFLLSGITLQSLTVISMYL